MIMNIYFVPFLIFINSVTSLHTIGCPENITAVWWSRSPYSTSRNNDTSVFHKLIIETTKKCCDQSHLTFIKRWKHGQEMEQDLEYDNDLLRFPVSVKLDDFSARAKYAKTFIPVITSPGAVYLVLEESISSSQISLVFLQLWPLLVIMATSTGFAGILIWALDCRSNSDHFPKSFIRGFPEGMWWAFVSMTTVGYGDRTPRTMLARAFGVIWILAGICVISVLTSIITAALTTATQAKPVDISNKKVAVLQGTEEHIIAISEGAIIKIECLNITCLLNETNSNKEVDGALLDELAARSDESILDDLNIALRSKIAIVHGIQIDGAATVERCYSRETASRRTDTYKHLMREIIPKKREKYKDKDAGDYAAGIIGGESDLFMILISVSVGILLLLVITLIIVDQKCWKHHSRDSTLRQHKKFSENVDRPMSDSTELQVSSSFGFSGSKGQIHASTNVA